MRSIPALLILAFLSVQLEAADPPARPKLISLYPLGGQAGETLEVELQGKFLDPLQVAWFYYDQVEAEVLKLERTEEAEKAGAGQEEGSETKPYQGKYRALLKVRISPDAELGAHYFRAVTPGGISNPLRFRVTSERNVREVSTKHNELDTAQPIDGFPVVIQGSLPELGEVDYYALQATRDQVLCFQVDFFSSTAPLGLWTMRPKLSIHERGGSWFDPGRDHRLVINDPMQHRPTLAYRFPRDGEFFLAVAEVSGKVGMFENPGYQLKVFPGETSGGTSCAFTADRPAHDGPLQWTWAGEAAQALVPMVSERDFARKLEADWIERLQARGVPEETNEASGGGISFESFTEQEPNDQPAQALDVGAIPAALEGTIGGPGDIDSFKFKVADGTLVAFEIETPLRKPSYFVPWMKVMNADGEEVVENLNKVWGRSGNFVVKHLEAKTVYTFEKGGEYTLQVRDITSRKGGSDFRYRVLVRDQVPHVGAIRPQEDHVRITPGQASTLALSVDLEEGFQGDVLLSVENLPPGVKAFPVMARPKQSRSTEDLPPLRDQKRYKPATQRAMIALMADSGALPSRTPWLIDLTARPIQGGKMGEEFAIGTLPLLVDGNEQRRQLASNR